MNEFPPALSPPQRRIFDPEIRVVEAGPGSGKTRCLVARFLREVSQSNSGVALLSFTNAAIDEIRARTEDPRATRAPHFVGTIDAFLNRFIVTPRVAASLGRAPSYLRSWSDLPEHHYARVVRVREVSGEGIGLERFVPQDKGFALAESSLRDGERKYLGDVDAANLRRKLVWIADKRISDYNSAGIFDPTTARRIAARTLKSSDGSQLVARLAQRFRLLLIDEAQDCDEFEFRVFVQLAAHVPTVLAADPDQAIFEFRGGSPEHFVRYRDAHDKSARMDLSENHRSNGGICKAVTALRVVGQADITPAEKTREEAVLVLSGSKAEVRSKFVAALSERSLSAGDAVVLAHRRATAAEVAGRHLPPGSRACGNRLAIACARLSDPGASVDDRLRAIIDAENIILDLVKWTKDDPKTCGRERQLDALERTATWLRASAARTTAHLSSVSDAEEFGKEARRVLLEVVNDLPRETSVSSKVKRPDTATWVERFRERPAEGLDFDTIHGFKGRERGAVLVALYGTGSGTVLDDWAAGLNTEARRVLYVGASRAESLLAFAATPDNARRVAELLAAAKVPMTRL